MLNMVKTTMLLTFMTMLFMGVGYLVGGQGGMLIALVLAAGMNLFSWWNSGSMVLKMHHAREVNGQSAPDLYHMVEDLAYNANLPMPKVYILDTDQPNAFATGRSPNHAAVAVSTGLLDRMTQEEVAAVMAHELAHIRNRDTLTMTITATLAGAIGMLANFAMFFGGNRNSPFGIIGALATMILAPMAAGLVQMAISRAREYEADKDGAEICGNPLWLASALEKIESYARGIFNEDAERAPATAHLFIINPLNGRSMDNLFSTHPNTANRIEALHALADTWQAEAVAPSVQDHFEPVDPPSEPVIERFGRNAGQPRGQHFVQDASNQRGKQADRPSSSPRKGPWE